MTDAVARAPRRPWFQATGVKLRVWPIALAAVLMQVMLRPANQAARYLFKQYPDWFHGQVWAFVAVAELFQIAIGLSAVLVLRRLLPKADPNLRWPAGRSSVGRPKPPWLHHPEVGTSGLA